MTERVNLAALDELKEALPSFTPKPLAHLSYLKHDQLEAYWLDEITQDLAHQSSTAFVSRIPKSINGLVLYADSPWDTTVIGRRVAVVKHLAQADGVPESEVLNDLLDEVIRHATSCGIECLICKIPSLEFRAIHALERHGFLLMDTLVDFVLDFSRTPFGSISAPKRGDGVSTRLARPGDLPQVLALNERAFASFSGRYHSDPKMPPGTGARVYNEWVCSSFRGWADWILVAEVEGAIAGYGLWKKASPLEARHSLDIAHYNLAGIHPAFWGRGLYTVLAFDGMRMAQSSATHLDGPVHVSNYPVHRALQKLGWRISGARHSFHRWLRV